MASNGQSGQNRPRTPSNAASSAPGLGINGTPATPTPTIFAEEDYDIIHGISDSPEKPFDASSSEFSLLTPSSTLQSSLGADTPAMGIADGTRDSDSNSMHQPFNFTPQQYVASSRGSIGKSEALGKRKGHKYRHSSIHASAMDSIFQPPTPRRTPMPVPASLPIPTRKEAWWSMTSEQTTRFGWSLCHLAVSAFVQFAGSGSLSMTALSRLLLFDAAGAIVCVIVDVMGNFEVWRRSSIRHPFGLERADVLAGFGMAVFIAFMGLDIISHGLQHSLESLGSHVPHSPHAHGRAGARSVEFTSAVSIVSTLVSAMLLKNHARIGKAMRFEIIANWGNVLSNPSHFLTLSCSVIISLTPWLNLDSYKSFDLIFAFLMAGLMIAFGVRLGTSLASMLLMSYRAPGPGRSDVVQQVIDEMERDPEVSSVEEARFWQVHYGLGMANIKVQHRGGFGGYGMDEVAKLRQRIENLVGRHLGTSSGVKWEIHTQLTTERD